MSESWLSRGNGPRVTRIGARVFYHPEDVEAYLQACRVRKNEESNADDLLEKSCHMRRAI